MKADIQTIDAKKAGSVDLAEHIFGLEPRGFDRAVEHALADWETLEPLGAR